jgi:phospholipid/cholesterol/gamma-HCH transport system substrate-binding protein
MERDIRYITVGLVVALLVAGLAGFAAWTAGTFGRGAGNRYTLNVEDDVAGLSEGSAVRYRGMEVGRVVAMRVAPEEPDRIKVDIEVRASTPVNRGTDVTIQPQGITGLSYISLRTPTAKAPPPATPPGERYPVLQTRASRFDRVMEQVPALVKRLSSVARRAEDLLNADNREQVRTLLRRSNRLVAHVDGLTEEAAGLVAQAEDSLTRLDATVAETRATVQDSRAVLPKLDDTLGNLRRLSRRLDRLVAGNEESLDRFAGEGLGELQRFLRDGRRTLAEIKGLARELRQDPSRILYRPPSSGVEVPQ